MVKRKIRGLFGVFIGFLLIISLLTTASAALEVTAKPVSTLNIKDMNLPAMFDVSIKNLGSSDTFSLYSLAGMNIEPNESFTIGEGETKEITLKAYSTLPLKVSPDYYSFKYKIKGENSGITEEELAVSIAYLKDSFNYYIEPINLDSTKAIVHYDNKYGQKLDNIHLELSSIF